MAPKKNTEFSLPRLLQWLNQDPYREAKLITEVPVKASTLARIKGGSYIPSVRMSRAIRAVILKEGR